MFRSWGGKRNVRIGGSLSGRDPLVIDCARCGRENEPWGKKSRTSSCSPPPPPPHNVSVFAPPFARFALASVLQQSSPNPISRLLPLMSSDSSDCQADRLRERERERAGQREGGWDGLSVPIPISREVSQSVSPLAVNIPPSALQKEWITARPGLTHAVTRNYTEEKIVAECSRFCKMVGRVACWQWRWYKLEIRFLAFSTFYCT